MRTELTPTTDLFTQGQRMGPIQDDESSLFGVCHTCLITLNDRPIETIYQDKKTLKINTVKI